MNAILSHNHTTSTGHHRSTHVSVLRESCHASDIWFQMINWVEREGGRGPKDRRLSDQSAGWWTAEHRTSNICQYSIILEILGIHLTQFGWQYIGHMPWNNYARTYLLYTLFCVIFHINCIHWLWFSDDHAQRGAPLRDYYTIYRLNKGGKWCIDISNTQCNASSLSLISNLCYFGNNTVIYLAQSGWIGRPEAGYGRPEGE